ncbi:MAG: SsrA-binding protein SmpB [Bacteroidetes bacterium]|nr:SsrA-binding protein SmpB [Bacteroidota bacterium]
MSKIQQKINIENRRAGFDYSFIEKYVAGLVLTGTEIKSIRQGKAALVDSYCYFSKGELWIKNMHIAEYTEGTHYNHEPNRERKLLLNHSEMVKLQKKLKDQGLTIVPIRLFTSESGYAKLEIALAKGKKQFDKREDIKKRDVEREMKRKF